LTAVPVSYSINYGLQDQGATEDTSLTWAQFNAPASTALLIEQIGSTVVVTLPDEGTSNYTTAPITKWESCAADGWDNKGYWGGAGATYATGPIGNRQVGGTAAHTNGANYVCADGHVKFFLPSSVSSGWVAAASTNYQDQTGSGYAAGTASMYMNSALTQQAALTFSPT
jgi:prepilin-type processing-associated H-X9-DG protein